MVSSDTDLANMALHLISGGTISDIDGTGKAAGLCKLYIDEAIFETISEGEFIPTIARYTLDMRTDVSRPDYNYAYYIPKDYVKGIKMEDGTPYEIEGDSIFSNTSGATLIFLKKLGNYARYNRNPWIVRTMAATLACAICMELKNDANLLVKAEELKVAYMRRAKSHDRKERNGQTARKQTWIQAFGDPDSGTDPISGLTHYPRVQ